MGVMTMEQGKPIAESRLEAAAGADVIDWFAEKGRGAYSPSFLRAPQTLRSC
jgi:acyl-CoA reductase-like NAD-dependent aldehyde dehydrogenase